MELEPTTAMFIAGTCFGSLMGFLIGSAYVVYANRRFISKGGHCACACNKGCC